MEARLRRRGFVSSLPRWKDPLVARVLDLEALIIRTKRRARGGNAIYRHSTRRGESAYTAAASIIGRVRAT